MKLLLNMFKIFRLGYNPLSFIRNSYKEPTTIRELLRYSNKYSYEDFIMACFTWSNTKEGIGYWNDCANSSPREVTY